MTDRTVWQKVLLTALGLIAIGAACVPALLSQQTILLTVGACILTGVWVPRPEEAAKYAQLSQTVDNLLGMLKDVKAPAAPPVVTQVVVDAKTEAQPPVTP